MTFVKELRLKLVSLKGEYDAGLLPGNENN